MSVRCLQMGWSAKNSFGFRRSLIQRLHWSKLFFRGSGLPESSLLSLEIEKVCLLHKGMNCVDWSFMTAENVTNIRMLIREYVPLIQSPKNPYIKYKVFAQVEFNCYTLDLQRVENRQAICQSFRAGGNFTCYRSRLCLQGFTWAPSLACSD